MESRHQNRLIFQYTSMANDVYLNGMRLHLDMNLIQSLNNMACTCMYTIGFLCTCLHSLLGTLGTCCIACTQCIMTPLTQGCIQLTSAPLSNSTWTHSMCPASEAFISAVSPLCNDKCISSWEYHQCQIHTTHQSDREYTRTSTTHSSTTHSTDTKEAPLGGTYSAPSCLMIDIYKTTQFNQRTNDAQSQSIVGALCLIPRM